MSEPRSLPPRPDLRHLHDEAKALRKAGEFRTLALAQLAIAHEYGFRSWPRLKFRVEALTLETSERAEALVRSGTSADLRRAAALLDADPELARHDLASACVTGEVDEVSRRLAARPTAVSEPTGPHGWEPILYACFSRLLRGAPERAPAIREVVRRLLAAGADPNAAFVNDSDWLQVALYGAAGINGDSELTRLLLEAGADPTDERDGYHGNEVLYHACEHPDPTCAMLVIDAGARRDLVDYNLGRALNFPNHEMIEMFCTHGARPWAAHLHQAIWRRRPPGPWPPFSTPERRSTTPTNRASRPSGSQFAGGTVGLPNYCANAAPTRPRSPRRIGRSVPISRMGTASRRPRRSPRPLMRC